MVQPIKEVLINVLKAVSNGVQIFKSIMEAERVTGVHNSNIVKCLKGNRKTSGGYKWQYINDGEM